MLSVTGAGVSLGYDPGGVGGVAVLDLREDHPRLATASVGLDEFLDPCHLVGGQIVHHDVVAGPLPDDLQAFFEAALRKLPGKSDLAAAFRYALARWAALTRYADDDRCEISNKASERAIRPLAAGTGCFPAPSLAATAP